MSNQQREMWCYWQVVNQSQFLLMALIWKLSSTKQMNQTTSSADVAQLCLDVTCSKRSKNIGLLGRHQYCKLGNPLQGLFTLQIHPLHIVV